MQILPIATDAAAATDALWSAQSAARSADGFAEYLQTMHTAMDNAENGESVSADAALAQENTAAVATTGTAATTQVQSPYTRTTSNGVTYTLEEVCFTKQELQNLRQQLAKAGVSDEGLERLDALADQPDGASLAMVLASLKTGGSTPQLSDDEKSAITSLLKKIDPTGVLDDNAQALMLQGNGAEALALIQNFVARLDQSTGITVTQTEALALGKGLGLSTSALLGLQNQFGTATELLSTPAQLSNLLAPATDYFTAAKTAQKTLDAALKDTLQPMLAKARARTEKEKQAYALQNKKAQQSKAVIDDTVQQKSRQVLEQTVTKTGTADANTAAGQSTAQQATARQTGQPSDQTNAARQSADAGAASLQQQTRSVQSSALQGGEQTNTGKKDQPATDDNAGKEDNTGKKDAWSDLLQTVAVKTAPATSTARADAQAPLYAAQNLAGETPAAVANAAATPPQLARQVAGQVESGLLASMQNGGTRLDLQLHPQELGAITLSLTVRNGEVTALIRPEKSETADMVNRQVEHIRLNLEQQGLKVDKVEVRLDSNQQDASAWQDLQQHNSWQEEDARREELARLKNLATFRNNNKNDTSATLEQPVHSLGGAAGYAAGTLNVVA
ncbi:flagellar hook-length control protein FliK [Desulfovibrio legallii]|uniref:Flagellar hook-length control protein FliK n=1 Tax=Desulfovibrio legallii TaxID=571438 RepID=A0A6H3F5I9_9BACT|nr:flagellar hook-length control protein FliK [Desulfovibrio legallii]RHH25714.1 flagellar hook-length control protein FliK [Desulfovibrio sp. AM18-2]TBH79929.1 flagellar hook-length control protein FliK [Desulfovibrio legallii]CAI3221416.1 Flagellar hook-length control protein FliK [Desulfovibrio diazotrophicus]